MKLLHSTACDFMVYKDYRNWFKNCLSSMWNQIQDPPPHLSSYRSSITIFFWSPSHTIFLILSFISLWSYTYWLIICCFRSSSRYAMQAEVPGPKIISLYLAMLSLMASSSSSFVFIQFRRGIFNSFASSNSDIYSLLLL